MLSIPRLSAHSVFLAAALPAICAAATVYQPTAAQQPWGGCAMPVYTAEYSGDADALLDAMRVIERAGYTVYEIAAPAADSPYVHVADSASDIASAQPFTQAVAPWRSRLSVPVRQHSRYRQQIEHETGHLAGLAHGHQDRDWLRHVPTDYNAMRWPIHPLLPLPHHLDDDRPADVAALIASGMTYDLPAVFDFAGAGYPDATPGRGLTDADLAALADLCSRWLANPAAMIGSATPYLTQSAAFVRWYPDDDAVVFTIPGAGVYGEATGGQLGPDTAWHGAPLGDLPGWEYRPADMRWRAIVSLQAIADVLGVGVGTGAWLRWRNTADMSDRYAPGVISIYLRVELGELDGVRRLILRQDRAALPGDI